MTDGPTSLMCPHDRSGHIKLSAHDKVVHITEVSIQQMCQYNRGVLMIEVSIQERYSHDRSSHITDVPI